jgi:hypothetical protein
LIPGFVAPITQQRADYVKGNRFYNIEDVQGMPRVRLIGNAALSFMTKMSSGYWNIFDVANGYTAINAALLPHLPLQKIHRRYFFESDLLFRLGIIQARVLDLPMTAIYGDEESTFTARRVFLQFLGGNLRNTCKRVLYSYFLRGFSVASLELLTGLTFLLFGVAFGIHGWATSIATGMPASTGTVMLAALPVILGVQLLLSFLAFDIAAVPIAAVASLLPPRHMVSDPIAVLRSSERCREPS